MECSWAHHQGSLVLDLGTIVEALEAEHFVARERELDVFTAWLEARPQVPEILNVSGAGGTGKSALLRAFRRAARVRNLRVLWLDGADFHAGRETFLAAAATALGVQPSPDLEHLLAAVNQQAPLILLDTFEALADLTTFIRDDLLPRLHSNVKVVIAGRQPLGLAWSRHDTWHRLVHPVALTGLSQTQAREYVRKRGLRDSRAVEGILGAAGGHPLALALAADLAIQRGVRDFRAAPGWRLALRMLVERLLEDVADPELRSLLEAGAVVRHFDESTLEALAGVDASHAFEKLWHLSVVQPAERGLTLHEDVRRILSDDLRWRHPERFQELRRRALAYYQERMRTARGIEREYLLAEQFFLSEDAFLREILFVQDEPGQVWVEPVVSEDHDDLVRIWSIWIDEVLPVSLRPTFDRQQDLDFLRDVLAHSGTRARVARDQDGRPLGFNTLLPLSRTSLPLLERNPGLFPAWRAFVRSTDGAGELPADPADATTFYLVHLAYTHILPDVVRATLARDLFGMLARGCVYLAASPIPAYQQLLQRMGWQPLADARNLHWSPVLPTEGYFLDLSRTGIDAWIAALVGMDLQHDSPPASESAPVHPPLSVPETSTSQLTLRERQIAELIARGLQNREIAAQLGVSVRTVDAHVEHIRRKLSVRSRGEITAWVVQQDQR